MKKFCFLLLIATLLFSCKQGGQQNKKNDDKPVITVTIEPLRYFTEAIAGDEFTVVSMVPKGSSPETYDPTPQQLVDLAQSKAYFRIGYIGFEQTWTEKLTDNAPHLQFFDMSENVELILDDTHAHHHKDGHVHEGHTHAGGVEPHIWNSTINAQIIAGNILNALCAIDKANESVYMERYNVLIRQIEHTDSLICQMLSSPNADRAFMIYHPALSYFARDYNLNQIPIEAGGKEPSPAHPEEPDKLLQEGEGTHHLCTAGIRPPQCRPYRPADRNPGSGYQSPLIRLGGGDDEYGQSACKRVNDDSVHLTKKKLCLHPPL